MKAIQEFVKYVKNHKEVWFAKELRSPSHWKKHHPYIPSKLSPYGNVEKKFIKIFGNVFEHSSWVAEKLT